MPMKCILYIYIIYVIIYSTDGLVILLTVDIIKVEINNKYKNSKKSRLE